MTRGTERLLPVVFLVAACVLLLAVTLTARTRRAEHVYVCVVHDNYTRVVCK